MAINRVSNPSSPAPTSVSDYQRQNALIAAMLQRRSSDIVSGSNIRQGCAFDVGGVLYLADSDTAISGTESPWVKLTPSGDGSTVSALFVSDLTGVSWNASYSGYYDVSGNRYIWPSVIDVTTGSSTVTYDLPDAAPGVEFLFRKPDSGTGQITLTPAGADTIAGVADSWDVTKQGGFVHLVGGNGDWAVKGCAGSIYELSHTQTTNASQSSPTIGTWYNVGSISLAVPRPGLYRVSWSALVFSTWGSTTGNVSATVSSANNSESDNGLTATMNLYLNSVAAGNTPISMSASKTMYLSAAATYYLNLKVSVTTVQIAVSCNTTGSPWLPAIIRFERVG